MTCCELAVWPFPVHVMVRVRVPAWEGVRVVDPESAAAPVNCVSPLSVHEVAFVLDHVRVTDCPV